MLNVNFLKKITIPLLAMGFCLSSFANTKDFHLDNDKLVKDYQQIVSAIIAANNNPNLNAQIFDISKRSFLDFLQNSSGYKKPDTGDIMGMLYYPQFKVNGKDTAFCFILYDGKSNLIKNYHNNTKLTLPEIIEYTALHEMGHCLIRHRVRTLNLEDDYGRKNEGMADKFALYLLNNQHKQTMINKILDLHKNINPEKIHYNHETLVDFSTRLRLKQIQEFTSYDDLVDFIIKD